jgi:hypothetical protein
VPVQAHGHGHDITANGLAIVRASHTHARTHARFHTLLSHMSDHHDDDTYISCPGEALGAKPIIKAPVHGVLLFLSRWAHWPHDCNDRPMKFYLRFFFFEIWGGGFDFATMRVELRATTLAREKQTEGVRMLCMS